METRIGLSAGQGIVGIRGKSNCRQICVRIFENICEFTFKRYEYRDDSGNWFRAYGNENWEFEANGLMQTRIASINDLAISERERKFHWPLGRRPDNHAGLSQMEL